MSHTTPVPPQKQGFFHMFAQLWSAGTVAINALSTAAQSLDDLAATAQAHTAHIRLSTEVELNAELQALTAQLNPQS